MTSVYVDSNSPSTPGSGTLGSPYRSLSIAESMLPGTLTDAYEVICQSTGGSADTTGVVLTGVTTSGANTLHIYADPAYRHAGKLDTSKYRLVVAGARAISNALSNITFTGLQATTSGASSYHCYYTQTATTLFNSCIAYGTETVGNGFHCEAAGTVRNCIAYGCNSGVVSNSGGNGVWQNCTSVANRASGFSRITSGTPTATNCYGGGNVTSAFTSNITLTTCASSDATGTSGLQSIAYSTSNFTNVTGGSEDLRIPSGSALVNVGTSLAGTFTTDIQGETRSGSWDIGADEYVSSSVDVTATPSAVTGTYALPAVGFVLDQNFGVTATTGTYTVENVTVSIGGSVVIEPSSVTATFSVQSTTFLLDCNFGVGLTTGTFSVKTVSVSTGETTTSPGQRISLAIGLQL
jgi:hypothetical protein